jgi:threonine synthase
VARWLPQQFYYFFAYKQWASKNNPPIISVPSGNFGNICAGILAHASGLPVTHFIAACNANDVIPQFLSTDAYVPKKAIATISNAMDVGNPSNFVRILQIFNQQMGALKKQLSAVSVSDDETKDTLKKVYQESGYLLDPHGAVGYHALENYLKLHPNEKGIVIETAHPVKFFDVVEPIIGSKVYIPETIQDILNMPKKATLMENNTDALRAYLMTI